jgi:hypothetical protein
LAEIKINFTSVTFETFYAITANIWTKFFYALSTIEATIYCTSSIIWVITTAKFPTVSSSTIAAGFGAIAFNTSTSIVTHIWIEMAERAINFTAVSIKPFCAIALSLVAIAFNASAAVQARVRSTKGKILLTSSAIETYYTFA